MREIQLIYYRIERFLSIMGGMTYFKMSLLIYYRIERVSLYQIS